MKKIMIDMDDVITCNNFKRHAEKFLGHNFDIENFKGYYLQDALGNRKKDFFKYLKDIDYYEDAVLEPDAYDVIKLLNKYYEVYIVTDFTWPNKEMHDFLGTYLKNKYDFLHRKFDYLSPNQFIFLSNKELLKCDIKIDDRVEKLNGADVKLLYTAYHNKNINKQELDKQNIIRVNNWKKIADILL